MIRDILLIQKMELEKKLKESGAVFAGIPEDAPAQVRAMDNIFNERLWRSLKYEEVYLKDYQCVSEGRQGIDHYFSFYNHERPHQSLNYMTPAEVYFQRAALDEEKEINLSLFKELTISDPKL